MEYVVPSYNPAIMAQIPNHDAHQWTHSIPQFMPWSLNQQHHQDIVQFTGHANSFLPQLAATSVPNAYSNGYFCQVQPQSLSPHVPLTNNEGPTSFPSYLTSAFPSSSGEVPGVKRHGTIDEDLAKLQPAPKIFVTAEKVTSDLGRLSLNQSSPQDSPINEEPVIECEFDEDSNDETLQITVSDDVQEILSSPSSDPLMGLGQKESDKLCKAVVVWQPPKPLSVKVESIVELDEQEDQPAAKDDSFCQDIEFEEISDELETMGE